MKYALLILLTLGLCIASGSDGFPRVSAPDMGRFSKPEEGATQEERDAFVRSVPTLVIEANGKVIHAALEDNASAEAFAEKLNAGDIEVSLSDYGGFEKVGPLPWSLPREDNAVATAPGDIMLYLGSQITIFYGQNTWDYTRLARIDGATREGLLAVFGEGDVTVRLWLEWSE